MMTEKSLTMPFDNYIFPLMHGSFTTYSGLSYTFHDDRTTATKLDFPPYGVQRCETTPIPVRSQFHRYQSTDIEIPENTSISR